MALSKANKASGCMKFIPGSHKEKIVAHVDTFDDNNLLSRGQEIAVEVNEKEAEKYPFKQEIIPTTDAYLEDGTVVDW